MADDLIDKGICISPGLRLLRSKSRCKDVLMKIPRDYVFIEIDDDDETGIEKI